MGTTLSYAEIQTIQDQQYDYTSLGYDKSLTKSVIGDVSSGILSGLGAENQFLSADDFAALTEGVKGGNLSIDVVKGLITIRDRETGAIKVLLGNVENET